MKPSDDFLQTVRQFETDFKAFHGKEVNRSSNVVRRFSKLLEDKYLEVPPVIIKKFSRLRTFIRLKDLNKEVREQQLTRRNAKQLRQFRI